MQITSEMIDHLARLSRLRFEGDEKTSIARDMQQMTDFVATLAELDTTGTTSLECMAAHPLTLHEDVPEPTFTPEESTAQSPQSKDHFFIVPKVIGG